MHQKTKKKPTLLEFNKILDKISHDDKVGHLFVVDIKFYNKNSKTLLFNEIYPPILAKKQKDGAFSKINIQLMTVLNRNEEKDTISRFAYNSKTHSALEEKKRIPLYAEDLHFLIKRAGWLVTCIYEHFNFEQAKFKGDFVIGNQKARLKAESSVEKISSNFYRHRQLIYLNLFTMI